MQNIIACIDRLRRGLHHI